MSTPAAGSGAVAPVDRRAAWLLVGSSAAALAVLSWLLVPWDWVPGGSLTPARVTEAFTVEQVARAEEYSRVVRLLAWASYAVSLVVALTLGLTKAGSAVARGLAQRLPAGRRWWVGVPCTVLVLLMVGRFVTLPFSVAIRERRLDAGLTRQSLAGWLGDVALNLLVSWGVTSLLVLLVVGLARWSPQRWFLWGGGVAAAMTFAGSLLYPVAVEPLFNDFTPMAEGPFKESVLAMADEEGVPVEDVLVADASRRTTTLNAYVSGIGGTRRLVVYDNLMASAAPAEARSIIAHELAHARHHDVVLGTGLGAVAAVLGVAVLGLLLDNSRLLGRAGVRGPSDPAVVALVLLLMAVGTLAASPLQNTVSRAIEARADRTALAATDDAEAFRDVQKRLALRSLADPTPPWLSRVWFGSHPTVLERLGLPDSLREAGG